MGPRPLWPNNCPKGAETGISREITKDVKSKCLSHVRPDHCAIGTEDTVHQGDFVGGPNLENNEPKMAHSRHLRNTHTCVGLPGPLLGRIEPHLVCGLCTPNLIYLHRRPTQDQKPKYERAAAAVLNFTKSVILGSSNGRMTKSLAAILNFQRVLFRARWPSYGQYICAEEIWCKSAKRWPRYICLCIFKMAATAMLNFAESWILGHSARRMANVYSPSKFDANNSLATEKWPKNKIQDGCRRHLKFLTRVITGLR